jgi:hypothetical protein
MAHELKLNEWVTLTPTIIDAEDSTYTYYGYEAPNSGAGGLTQCSIKRVSSDTSLVEWAGGNPTAFIYDWEDRGTDLDYNTRKS